MKHLSVWSILLGSFLLACGGPGLVEIAPVEIDSTLRNPHRGFVTTHQYNSDIGDKLHPPSTVVQFRWYWSQLEPQEGRIRFGMIDSVLARCREEGQKLNFRVMCQNGGPRVPMWVRDAGAEGEPYENNPDNWQPHYDDPVFLEKHRNLIDALGKRYDGHPDVDNVDIGTVGRWGEWHTGGTGMDMPDFPTQKKIIDMYFDSFRQTPLIALIGAGEGLGYAVEKGAGWRADCLGDMGGFEDDWNHMEDFYQQALDAAGANDAWKHAPVIFETCWTIRHWYDQGWDIDFILSEALRWHVSELNNATESIPEEWWPKIVEFEKKMGYRYVLRRMVHPSLVSRGGEMLVEMDWENIGVAPIYRNYPLIFQFRHQETGESTLVETGVNITGWLPGDNPVQLTVKLPENLASGKYDLGLALLNTNTLKPAIKLAIEGRDEDGWYRLSEVRVH